MWLFWCVPLTAAVAHTPRVAFLQQAPVAPAAPAPVAPAAAVAAAVVDPAYEAWVAQLLPLIPVVPQYLALEVGLQVPPIAGLMLEFGVFTGTSINLMAAQRPSVPMAGFDSFEGLPDEWRPGFDKGAFDLKGKLPTVPANVQLVPGWFDKTLPGYLAANPGPISLLHVDCDMYSSTKTIFDNCAPRIVPGTVIVFDELVNYPEYKEHELKAFYEFILQTGHTFQWLSSKCPVTMDGMAAVQGTCCSVGLKILT